MNDRLKKQEEGLLDKLDPSKELNPEPNGSTQSPSELDGRTFAEVVKSDEPISEPKVESVSPVSAVPFDTSEVKDRSPATSSTASIDNELKAPSIVQQNMAPIKPARKEEPENKPKDPEHAEIDHILSVMRQESVNLGNQINEIDQKEAKSPSSGSKNSSFEDEASFSLCG